MAAAPSALPEAKNAGMADEAFAKWPKVRILHLDSDDDEGEVGVRSSSSAALMVPHTPIRMNGFCRCKESAKPEAFATPPCTSVKPQCRSAKLPIVHFISDSDQDSDLPSPRLNTEALPYFSNDKAIAIMSPQSRTDADERKIVVLSSDEESDTEVEFAGPSNKNYPKTKARQRRRNLLLQTPINYSSTKLEIEKADEGQECSPSTTEICKSEQSEIAFCEGQQQQVGQDISLATKEQPKPVSRNLFPTKKSDFEAAKKVKETLKLFNSLYLRFVQEEEARCGKECAQVATMRGKKRSFEDMEKSRKKSRRPDLKAISLMKKKKDMLYDKKMLGHVPGINVGDQFFSRCEMLVIGLHGHWLNGIEILGSLYKKLMPNYDLPIAVSIVLSGNYEDDLDNAEDVVYTGQGGNDLLGNKRQIADQVMERGNLALKNSMLQDLPVRLIRGHKTKKSYSGKVYTYDGLYKVKEFWAEKGISGFTVFKFRLHRIIDQPALTTDQVNFCGRWAPSSSVELQGLVCEDISFGLENLPILATNVVDKPPFAPKGYKYLNEVEVDKGVRKPLPAKGCDCKGECVDATKCACAIRNGKKFPYVSKNGGRLVEPLDVVYECGPSCKCGPSCSNRTSQRGIVYHLEVFQTARKGWGVRSWDSIPAGAPVCEYTGLLMRTEDADCLFENEYLLELDCIQTMQGVGSRQRRILCESTEHESSREIMSSTTAGEQPEYCINAGSSGNVSRFFNHSCEPNLFIQCVVSSHHDLSQPRVIFVASENIKPLQELTYDYGFELGSVVVDGKVKTLPCYCGSTGCRKRLY